VRVFKAINGPEGLLVPGDIGIERFEALYSSPAASGRSRGAGLSDLFWYWLAPGPELHQEHLEPGERYDEVAKFTRRILALPKAAAETLAAESAAQALDAVRFEKPTLVRLRDLMMPIWANFYHSLVFGEAPREEARALIVANADDVVTALKCVSLRHMACRARLTRFLTERIAEGRVPHPLPACLDDGEKALYLQGVFFNTAIVQSSEAMAHVLLALAEHPAILRRLLAQLDDDRAIDRVVTETLRLYPLFGIAHRITSEPISDPSAPTLPAGSVLCFDYPAYHKAGYADPERFDPERWSTLSVRDANYLPFGMVENRPCPAQAMALITIRAVTREVLRRYSLTSSALHTRSLPSRGPCLLIPRGASVAPWRLRATLARIRLRDRWEDVGRSFAQLFLGTYMVLDARRLGLCRTHFEHGAPAPPLAPPPSGGPARCPFPRSES
jgi:cytochrome P450